MGSMNPSVSSYLNGLLQFSVSATHSLLFLFISKIILVSISLKRKQVWLFLMRKHSLAQMRSHSQFESKPSFTTLKLQIFSDSDVVVHVLG